MGLNGWNGDGIRREAQREARRRLNAAAITVQDHAKRLLSVAGTAPGRSGGRRVYGATRSAPGEPPRKQTGRLRASVAREVDGLTARVGTNVKYGLHLEIGTRHMAARPWLRRSLAESRNTITRIFEG